MRNEISSADVGSESNYDFSDQVGHLLRRAYQRHTALFQQLTPDSQLTAAQFVVLCSIRDNAGTSLAEIVKRTVIDQATIRGVVDRLKQRGLITIMADPSDRRKSTIHLTAEGEELVKGMEPFAVRISEITYGSLNVAEQIALKFLLKKMIASPDSIAGLSASAKWP